MQKIIVLFGVSGCGKSTIGKRLSEDLQFHFIEGDYFHTYDNINKMKKKTKAKNEGWSQKYKKSIDCNNPKGFSQKAHCAGRKKR